MMKQVSGWLNPHTCNPPPPPRPQNLHTAPLIQLLKYIYIYTGLDDLRVRPSAPPPKPIPVVVRFSKFFRTVKFRKNK